MLKRRWVAAALGCSLFAPLVQGAGESVRFDGLYATSKLKDGVQYFKYLRFYQDGLVLGVSSAGSPEDIRKWFIPTNENIAKGRYRLSGSTISFSLSSQAGVVDYKGEVMGSETKLRSHSRINGNEGEETYSFVGLKAEQNIAADRGENAAPAER